MCSLPGNVSEAEEKLEAALKLLVERNSLFVKHSGSKRGGWIDAEEKIDRLLYLRNFLALPIQVKRNNQEVELHLSHHPHIFPIKIEKSDTPEKIAEFIEHTVMEILKDPYANRVRASRKSPA